MSANNDLYLPGVKDRSSGGRLLMMLHHAVVSSIRHKPPSPEDFCGIAATTKVK
jgi:hypothetical protein